MNNNAYQYGEGNEYLSLDYTRCQRPDGSYYGTGGVCRKGAQVGAKEKEARKKAIAKKEAQLEKAKTNQLSGPGIPQSVTQYRANKVETLKSELADLKSGKTQVKVKSEKEKANEAKARAKEKPIKDQLKSKGLPSSGAAFNRAVAEGTAKYDNKLESIQTERNALFAKWHIKKEMSDAEYFKKSNALEAQEKTISQQRAKAYTNTRSTLIKDVTSVYKSTGEQPPKWAK